MTQLATAQDRTVHVDLYARLAEESRVERTPAPWLDELRRSAMTRFEQVGFPSNKDEEWRFTNIAPIAKTPFKLAERVPDDVATDVAASFSFGNEAVSELVFVNGHFAPDCRVSASSRAASRSADSPTRSTTTARSSSRTSPSSRTSKRIRSSR